MKISQIFKALSDENRIRILALLMEKPLCVCEIQHVLDLAMSTVSAHLSFLKKVGFIIDEKEKKWVNYKINYDTKNPVVSYIIKQLPLWFKDEKLIHEDKQAIKNTDRNLICKLNKQEL